MSSAGAMSEANAVEMLTGNTETALATLEHRTEKKQYTASEDAVVARKALVNSNSLNRLSFCFIRGSYC